MSLNSRISTREKYCARGGVVDCEIEPHLGSSAHPEATTDAIILEPVKHQAQNDCMNRPVAEPELEERVNSEWCDRHVIMSHSYALSRPRDCYALRELAY